MTPSRSRWSTSSSRTISWISRMTGRTTRKSREQCLQTIASSLIVSAQNGHSIRMIDFFCDAGAPRVRSSPDPVPAAASRACAPARHAPQSAIAAPRSPASRSRKPAPRAGSPARSMDKRRSGGHLQDKTRCPDAAIGILDVDANHVLAGWQFDLRHVDAARQDKGSDPRREVDIRRPEIGHLD